MLTPLVLSKINQAMRKNLKVNKMASPCMFYEFKISKLTWGCIKSIITLKSKKASWHQVGSRAQFVEFLPGHSEAAGSVITGTQWSRGHRKCGTQGAGHHTRRNARLFCPSAGKQPGVPAHAVSSPRRGRNMRPGQQRTQLSVAQCRHPEAGNWIARAEP